MSLLLAMLLSQGMTADAGAWTVAGPTTFLDPVTFRASLKADSVSAGTITVDSTMIAAIVVTNYITPPLAYQGVTILGRRDPWDTASTADVQLGSYLWREAGNLLEVDNAGNRYMWVDNLGGVAVQQSGSGGAAFTDMSSSSGHTALTVMPGKYVSIVGKLPPNYYGHHGAITISADANVCYPLEVDNGVTGTATDKKFMVNYQGAIEWHGGQQCNSLAPCGDYDNAPSDGGTIGTDAGTAKGGAFIWVTDIKRHCYCDPSAGNEYTGWRRVSDDSQCCP